MFKITAQQTLNIPEFKNINTKDPYPLNTILSSYTNQFDVVISLKCYSNWGPDHDIKMLAFNCSGWYKIEINSDRFYLDTTISRTTYKIRDSIGKKIWDTLLLNHLFDMEDERSKDLTCSGKIDTIKHENGKIEIREGPRIDIDDGAEYEFEIITKDKYKKLYFYEPKEFNKYCQKIDERTWIINCISIFEKYLGK